MSPLKIRRLRLSLGWTQAVFANVLGVHRSTISRWECGKQAPSLSGSQRLELLAGSARRPKPKPEGSRRDASRRQAGVRTRARNELIAKLDGRTIVASISGGKDSAAMSLYLHELGIDHQRIFLDTGWESSITYEYLRAELPKAIGPITWIRGEQQMEDLIRHKGMFPSRTIRFCTQELKVKPMIRHLRALMEAGQDVINAVGIRAAESAARSQMVEWEFQEGFDCEVWRPLIRWTEQNVIDIHRRHRLKPNPLYLLGALRVGCWPCIHARKSEVRLIAETDPGRIVRLRVLEDQVGVSARRRAELAGRSLGNAPSWFMNPLRRLDSNGKREGGCWSIERVVEWSRTAYRGAAQLDKDEFLLASQSDGCLRWGLCDTGVGAGELAQGASHAARTDVPPVSPCLSPPEASA